jgi:hypothetical protein
MQRFYNLGGGLAQGFWIFFVCVSCDCVCDWGRELVLSRKNRPYVRHNWLIHHGCVVVDDAKSIEYKRSNAWNIWLELGCFSRREVMSCQGMSPRAHHPCLIQNLHGAQLHILPSLIVSLASPICSFIQVQLRSAFFVHPWQALQGLIYSYIPVGEYLDFVSDGCQIQLG